MKPLTQDCAPFDLNTVRQRLQSARGPRYWRSLDEVARTKAFEEFLHREFPAHASQWTSGCDRRGFLKLMGASLALAGLTACTQQPMERIAPYVKQPEDLVPGKPLFYATAMTLGGYATGLLVESHEGHPTKIEGNPEHPMSLGVTNVFHQASLLDLYDPDRSQAVLHGGQISSWAAFLSTLHAALSRQAAAHGAGLRILTETVTSPTMQAQLQAVLEKFPAARWHQFEPINRDNVHAGARLAFGDVVEAQYHFDQANVVLALDADFMFAHPASLRYTRAFVERRRANADRTRMNRLYAVESTPSVTGSNADHRLALRSDQIADVVRVVAQQLGAPSGPAGHSLPASYAQWIAAVVDDLQQNRGASLVIAGEHQPPFVHALAHLMNDYLGNAGQTVHYTASAEAAPVNQLDSLRELADDLQNGNVDVLLVLGGNPAYTAPADFQFAQRLAQSRLRVHLSPDVNETSALCQWHLPQNHYLESWSDARAIDGTVSVVQPLILPLYAGKSAHEVLEAVLQRPARSDYEIVRHHWQSQNRWPDFEHHWRQVLHDGWMPDTALPEIDPPVATRGDRQRLGRRCQSPIRNRQSAIRNRTGVSPGPHHLGRSRREQRLAPGTGQAHHEANVGQCRVAQSRDRATTRIGQRAVGETGIRRSPSAFAGVDYAGPGRRLGGRVTWLWPHARWPRRHRHGVQCVCRADCLGAVVRRQCPAYQDGRALSARHYSDASRH